MELITIYFIISYYIFLKYEKKNLQPVLRNRKGPGYCRRTMDAALDTRITNRAKALHRFARSLADDGD